MSWSEGNKKWTIPFVSLNGTSCHVDIYKRGYTGSSVTTLTGAADAFEYSENDDEDLLNKVIRYRTGYIRVIESTYGDLADIYPSVNTDRWVEFYYGNDLDFVGYIQAQGFDNDWVSGPRELELPVISPLGLASGVKFDWNELTPPTWMTIWNVIKLSLDSVGNYNGFYFPQYLPHVNTIDRIVMDLYVNTLTFCPFGGKYDKETSDLAGIYEPKTVEDALTMICTGFGLILHDAPEDVVFQRVDWTGDYLHKRLSDGSRSRETQSTYDFTSFAEVAGSSNTESVVMPLSKIDVTYEGDENVPNMTFDRCRGYSRGCAIDDRSFCTNDPNIEDFETDGSFTIYTSIDANGMMTKGDICLGAYGGGGLTEMIMFRPNDNWPTVKEICTVTFFEWNGSSFRLKFSHKYGTSIENMKNPSHNDAYANIGVLVTTSSMYYDPQNGWQNLSSLPTNFMTKQFNDGRVDCEVGIPGFYNDDPEAVSITFYAGGNRTDWIRTISNVSLENFESANDAYLKKNQDLKTYTLTGDPSDQSGDLKRGIGVYAPTMNRIRYGSNITGTAESDIADNEPTYSYLLKAQDRLQIDVSMLSYVTADVLYMNRFTVWGSNNKHRIIASSFKPWNDVHRITFHHSIDFD